MYETFYRLSATPFRLMPDARFCFQHSGYEQARAYLQYAFELGEGFIVLTGRVGAGKTTLVESFLARLQAGNVAAARLAAANIKATDLLRSVAYAYGIEAESLDKATLLRRMAEHFSGLLHRGQRVLLVIDEAQGLSCSALEELRLLADLAEGARPLLQIFLVGQEKLRSVMRQPDMEQLRQRVIGTCRLEPMGLAETRDYIEHRLSRAGWKGDPEFTGDAVLAVFQYSGGTPRHVNKICTRLMLQGFMENKHILDKDDVINIASELDEELLAPAVKGGNRADGTVADPVLAAALQTDSAALSGLAVRTPKSVGEVCEHTVVAETAARPAAYGHHESRSSDHRKVPEFENKVKRLAVSEHLESRPAGRPDVAVFGRKAARPAVPEHRNPRMEDGEVPVGQMRQWQQFSKADRTHVDQSVWNRVWRAYSLFSTWMVSEFGKLQEKPAALFSLVAVATVCVASITSYLEHRPDGQHKLFVVNSQTSQPGSRAIQDDEGGEPFDPLGTQLAPQVQEAFVVAPAVPSLSKAVPDPVPLRKKTVRAVAGGVSQQPAPASAAAVEVSPVVAPAQAHGALAGVEHSPLEQSPEQDGGISEANDPGTLSSEAEPDAVAPSGSPRSKMHAPVMNAASSLDGVGPSTGSGEGDAPGPVALAESAPKGDVGVLPPEAPERQVAMAFDTRINDLVTLAREALSEDRLLIPEGNNAYGYYQQVLSLEPGNAEARNGLRRIVERYITLASQAIDRQDETRARRYIARGLRVQPREQRLLVLRDMMNRVSFDTQPKNPPPASSDAQPASRPADTALERPPRETTQPVNMFQRLKEFFSGKSSASLERQEP